MYQCSLYRLLLPVSACTFCPDTKYQSKHCTDPRFSGQISQLPNKWIQSYRTLYNKVTAASHRQWLGRTCRMYPWGRGQARIHSPPNGNPWGRGSDLRWCSLWHSWIWILRSPMIRSLEVRDVISYVSYKRHGDVSPKNHHVWWKTCTTLLWGTVCYQNLGKEFIS